MTPQAFAPQFTIASIGLVLSIATTLSAKPVAVPLSQQLDRAINTTLNLKYSWHTTLRIDATPERPISIEIPIENVTYTLEVEPYSIRADEYKVLMQNDEGELYEVPAGPIRTLRGSLLEVPGSVVAGSLMEDGLYARIRFEDEDNHEYWLEPVSAKLDRAPDDLYVLYRTTDVIPSGGTCAADEQIDVGSVLEMLAKYDSAEAATRGDLICTAQLGVDTDYEYYQDWGSSTESRINQVINGLNSQYESQLNLTHEITTIIVRSSPNDPYTTNNSGSFLDQFATEWYNNQGSITRDVAHLFTGKNLSGGIIGIAWLGAMCSNSMGYSLAQSDCCGSFACTTDLSAHELGHNWSAGHCSCNTTMNSYLVCANNFGSSSINTITAYANSINCLTCENAAPEGACCIGNNCVEIYESNCDAGGGIWQGDNSSCGNSSCVAPVGACCVSGSCYEYDEDECSNAGGTYYGDETNCSTVSCALGACCTGIDCALSLQTDCSGSWYGDNTTCAEVSCGAGADELNYEMRTWSRSDGQAMATFDLYFPSTDPNTLMVAVFGQDADLLQIRAWSNAAFDGSASLVAPHQSIYGSDTVHDRAFDPLIGDDLVYDSYVTVGTDDAAVGLPTLLGFDSDGFNSATGVSMDNGVWFVIPDDPLASIGAGTALGHRVVSLSVESGQGIEFLLNVQWFDGAGFVHETRNIYWNNQGIGPVCETDLDGNGYTDVSDLLTIIGQWGSCSGCSGDIDGNGQVDVTDILIVIGAWGPC